MSTFLHQSLHVIQHLMCFLGFSFQEDFSISFIQGILCIRSPEPYVYVQLHVGFLLMAFSFDLVVLLLVLIALMTKV